jgi:RsiW-degrading membrane proteinase PrsW (M82 family)
MRKTLLMTAIVALVMLPLVVDAASSLPGKAITITDIKTTIKSAVQTLMTVAALAVVAFIVYGGMLMAMSAGNDAKYKQGKDIIRNAIIGGVVIFGVGVIVNTIFSFTKSPTDSFDSGGDYPSGGGDVRIGPPQ